MNVERQPLVRVQQRESVETARQTALGDVSTRLQNLSSAVATLRDAATWGDVQTVDVSDATKLSATRTGGAAAGAYSIQITQLARANQWTQTAGATTAAAADTLHITVGTGGGATTANVAIAAGDTLQTVADKVNAQSTVSVYASVVNNKLVFSNKVTGTTNAISAITTGGASGLAFAETQTARNSTFSVDGTSYTRESNTVSDVLAGLTLTLRSQTATNTPVTLNVGSPTPDLASIQSKVQAFVDQYNSTVTFIRGKLDEKVVVNPQSNFDRSQGVLRADIGLESLLSSLREAVGDVVSPAPGAGSFSRLSELGISTGATTGSGTLNQDAIAGKLVLDTSKLADALNNHLSDVKAMFTNQTGAYASEGIAQRLDGYLNPWLIGDGKNGSILDGRIASSQSLVSSLKDQETVLNQRLADKQAQLQLQFTNLETVMSQMQSQQQWLASQLSKL
jgi:flagellar hook-associated protein 2